MTEAVGGVADPPGDAVLIAAVRQGNTGAYGALYERHLGAARRAAAAMVSTAAEREDLVAEAFTRVLRVLRSGRGPDEEFRAYLLTTLRNLVISARRRGPQVSLFAEVPDNRIGVVREDPMGNRVHANLVADAFASLPERWRVVLWHTEIEGESPAEIAPLLGLTPNSVAALAYRAREGLRQAYLQQHLPAISSRQECQALADQLAGWVRRGMPAHKMRRISTHLKACPDCRELVGGLKRINSELRGVVAPLILGAPVAFAYLSSAGTSSGAVVAAGSTVSWLTTVKVAVVGVAVTTAAITTVASDVASNGGGVAAGNPPAGTSPVVPTTAPRTPRAGQPTPKPAAVSSDVPASTTPSTPTTTETTAPAPASGSASHTDLPAVDPTTTEALSPKEERQAAKAEAKAEKQAAKDEKKAEKKNK